MVSGVNIDRGAVERLVDRQADRGTAAAARFMADQQRKDAPSPEIAQSIGHRSGKDLQGHYARAGVMRFADDPKRWHRWDGARWQVTPYPDRETTPVPTWRLYEFGTPRTAARPFLRGALWNNTRRVAQLLAGGR